MSRSTIVFLLTAMVSVVFSVTSAQETQPRGTTTKPADTQPTDDEAEANGKENGDRSGTAQHPEARPRNSAARIQPTAPPFRLADSSGNTHTLDQYKDQILVLEWIHPECPYVTRLYRSQTMQKLAKRYSQGDRKVIWLAINSSHFATRAQMEAWRSKHSLPYPILLDPTGSVGKAYGAVRTPHMFIVKDRQIVYSGAVDDAPLGRNPEPTNYVAQALDELLTGTVVSRPKTTPYGCFVKYAAPSRSSATARSGKR
ncbi:MAG: redoxin family protein [Planctomycetota bacterium]